MKICNMLKLLGMTLLLLILTVGCDTTPEKVEATDSSSAAADAIAAAKAANKIASDEGYEWRDTGKIIIKAEKALTGGDDAKAIKLANQARRQAENAVKQKYAELERLKDILGNAQAKQSAIGGDYLVMSGDNLWDISGKADVYGNPYQWPMIYKANRSIIKDADLIYPGQEFTIDNGVTAEGVSAAVQHAKMRGSWSLGAVESTDTMYLAQ